MRYALRNQTKLINAFGQKELNAMISALDSEFANYDADNEITLEKEPYPIIMATYGVDSFAFYIIEKKYDVVRLAFKEKI